VLEIFEARGGGGGVCGAKWRRGGRGRGGGANARKLALSAAERVDCQLPHLKQLQ